MYFQYGLEEINYLKNKDKMLARIIDQIGHVKKEVRSDLFACVVNSIIGQQISTKAHQSIWGKFQAELGVVNAGAIIAKQDKLQGLGISYRKADYILDFAKKVASSELNLDELSQLGDDEFITELSKLKGIGVWTAEMILIFCLQRPNVFSYGDLAILRGIRMVYHHRFISKELFEKYRRRFSPYCSVVSLYFWAVAGGAIPELRDYAPKYTKNINKISNKTV
ncbi:3-methyladenine DNA glycosylase/8-oxoguanine DNA glycosylase [Campylobacter iguaniorum]|uniref:DNA-3-methyladenine glycosylase II n=1 Tax=Campylobacter iguaniorum TaxID=1244531 RepID=A0A076FBM8_9BACT|nr:DNA-3-methyladenine glycosylase [Campylobacter iguaniorum]AII15336.1 3-methyladenine DNA glycosylase/8-oxoguanine DNA glycosylase [Campylobacter iguaniorum]ALV25266.1 3-methyladenine DNA glycosylase/8-oxoguanine DNA glycosylase [Campylobacter iguaniorum]